MSSSANSEKDSHSEKTPSVVKVASLPRTMQQAQAGRAWCAYMVYSCVVVGMSGALFGIENSMISPITSMTSFVDFYQGPNPKTGEMTLTASNTSIIFSIPLTGTIIGALAATPLQNRFGRKWTLFCCYLFSLPAVFLQLFAPNFGSFVAGRWLNALDYGVATAVAPTFLADLVVASARGSSVASNNIFTIFSAVLSTIICWAAEETHSGTKWSYKIPLIVQVVLPFFLIALTFFISESPIWLINKGRTEEARATLRKIRGYSDAEVEAEFIAMKAAEDSMAAITAGVHWYEIFQGRNLKRTLVSGSFFSLNQISGIILSTTFATNMLTALGAGDPFVLTVVASVCSLVGALAAPFVLDFWGRRPVALLGFAVLMFIDIAAGALAFHQDNRHAVKAIAALSFIFNFVWTISFYAISLLLPAELPTTRLRNPTMSYAVGWGQTTAVITTFAVPQLTSADAANLGAKTYLVFAGCMALILIFAALLLPETRNRSFAAIDELYANDVPAWRWKSYQCSVEIEEAVIMEHALTELRGELRHRPVPTPTRQQQQQA